MTERGGNRVTATSVDFEAPTIVRSHMERVPEGWERGEGDRGVGAHTSTFSTAVGHFRHPRQSSSAKGIRSTRKFFIVVKNLEHGAGTTAARARAAAAAKVVNPVVAYKTVKNIS